MLDSGGFRAQALLGSLTGRIEGIRSDDNGDFDGLVVVSA